MFSVIRSFPLHPNLHLSLSSSPVRLFARSSKGISERVDKILSNRGIGTRKDVEAMIKKGLVKLDGQVIKTSRYKISPTSTLSITGLGTSRPLPTLLAFNKPPNVLTDVTENDGLSRPSLSSYLPPTIPGEDSIPLSKLDIYHPVGRLDYETRGLLIFSNDGVVT
eukprot:CAMPEP_0118655428 /NCGR_PEP_ID=MMETSP0785-20121206/12919_1 /TAXON_ID=91992 /ORGANISM="Bolidomonas pacifica, Strain CCMP 1866" /LENGTH=164 /DNA_ID=CAMNT_0006548157 /DNA_START=243 /DNA_END=733 /DNA_ORIENTATION=-